MANKESVTSVQLVADPIIGSRAAYLTVKAGETPTTWAARVDETLDERGQGYRPLALMAATVAAGKLADGRPLTVQGPSIRVQFDSGHAVMVRPDGIYTTAPGHRVSLEEAKRLEGRWVEYTADPGALTEAMERTMALEIKAGNGAARIGADLSDL